MRSAHHILRQHAEHLAFLWAQRDDMAALDPPDDAAIAEWDSRIAAEIDALAIAGNAAWPALILQVEDWPEKGELFAFAVHALSRQDQRRITQALNFATVAQEERGLRGAISWLEPAVLAPTVRLWWGSDDPACRTLAVASYRLHGIDPGPLLPEFLADRSETVRAEACRLAGSAGRRDVVPRLRAALDEEAPVSQLAAALGLAALGEASAAAVLQQTAIGGTADAQDALRAAIGLLDREAAQRWITELAHTPGQRALAVRAVGMRSGPEILPWLVARMSEGEVAAAAGAAFQEIAGPVEEPDVFFYPDLESAARVLGDAVFASTAPVPIANAFHDLLEQRSV